MTVIYAVVVIFGLVHNVEYKFSNTARGQLACMEGAEQAKKEFKKSYDIEVAPIVIDGKILEHADVDFFCYRAKSAPIANTPLTKNHPNVIYGEDI